MGRLDENLALGAPLTDVFALGEGSLAVKFETSTATNTIQDEEATAVQLRRNVKRRKMRTAKEGNLGLEDKAGVQSKHALVAAPVVTCIRTPGISTIFTAAQGST